MSTESETRLKLATPHFSHRRHTLSLTNTAKQLIFELIEDLTNSRGVKKMSFANRKKRVGGGNCFNKAGNAPKDMFGIFAREIVCEIRTSVAVGGRPSP